MNSIQHPLVDQYLDDLARMLDHLPPGDRAEVLAGVREHIEAGLAERPGATDPDVSRVLAELGPPEAVAREAYDAGPGSGQHAEPYAVPSPQPAQPRKRPISDRAWVPVLVGILQVLGLLLLLAVVGSAGVYVTTEVTMSGGQTSRTVDYQIGTTLMLMLAGGVLVLPLWIGVVLLSVNSRLWTTRQKLVHCLLLAGAGLVVGLAPDLGWGLAGERGLNFASVTALVLAIVVGTWLVVRLTIAGRRRSVVLGP